jgi:hypothetical protein
MATNGNINDEKYAAPAQTADAPASADGSTNNLPKDEVGWYFVEQYYTTMSKSPERLHVSPAPFRCCYAAQLTIRTAVLWQEGTVRLRSRGGGRECFFWQTSEYPLRSD